MLGAYKKLSFSATTMSEHAPLRFPESLNESPFVALRACKKSGSFHKEAQEMLSRFAVSLTLFSSSVCEIHACEWFDTWKAKQRKNESVGLGGGFAAVLAMPTNNIPRHGLEPIQALARVATYDTLNAQTIFLMFKILEVRWLCLCRQLWMIN